MKLKLCIITTTSDLIPWKESNVRSIIYNIQTISVIIHIHPQLNYTLMLIITTNEISVLNRDRTVIIRVFFQ